MKKLLFCAGVLALAASSCTEDFDTLSVQQEQAQGITFVAGNENEAATKGFYDEVMNGSKIEYEPFWWAEQDRIGIISKNTKKGYSGFATTITNWATSDLATKTAVYKATQSQRSGVFTSVNDDNMLDFNAGTAEFLAIYPYNTSNGGGGNNYVASSTTAGKIKVGSLKDLKTQSQNDVQGNGIYESLLKWSYTTATPDAEKPYEAVGEKIELDFQRALSGMVFRTANATKYTKPATPGGNSIFGNLLSVKAELMGAKQTDGTYDKSKTPALIYNSTDAALTLTMPAVAGGEVNAVWSDGTTAATPADETKPIDAKYLSSTVQMDGTSGLEWNDDARAYMIVLPLQMENIEKQTIKITYSFKNIDFEVTKEMGQKNWKRGTFYRAHTLDINDYDYLLTKESNPTGNTNDRTLIVNKGDFSKVFKANGNINWPIGTTGNGVSKEEVGTIIVAADVNVTENNVKGLKDFTNLTSVEMPQVTTIPAGTFTAAQAAKLKTIIMPAVTEIASTFADANMTVLENLNLAAYAFENETVNGILFNTDNKDNLKTLNISGVASMTPMFGIERTLSFQGYTALTTVTVQDGVRLCANAFNDCQSLDTVNGVVNMLNGTSAFQGCTSLTTINIDGTVIPADAFNGCTKLTNVLKDDVQVKPTKVGENAFKKVAYNVSGYFYMDLRDATEIGENAFLNSKLRSGRNESDILTVGVQTVESGVFAGSNVRMVQFLNATGIKNKVFNNAKDLIQVKFLKPFAYAGGEEAPGKNIFSGDENNENLILFVCDEQTGWSGTKLTLTNGTDSMDYTFRSITIENEPYAEQ